MHRVGVHVDIGAPDTGNGNARCRVATLLANLRNRSAPIVAIRCTSGRVRDSQQTIDGRPQYLFGFHRRGWRLRQLT